MPADSLSSDLSPHDALEISTQRLTIGRQLLHVATHPGRVPPLLLCNGLGANLELLFPLMRALEGVSTIAFDVPGTGDSPPSHEPLRMRAIAEIVARMVARLGHAEIDVLGVSWGGLLAQQLAAQYPAQVRRLILVSTGPGANGLPGDLATSFHMANPRRWHDINYLERIAPSLYGGLFRREPKRVREIFRSSKQPSFVGYYGQIIAALGWSSTPWLHRLPQPTLIIAGTDDPLVPAANARILAHQIPNARLRLFDDGHMVLMTRISEIAPLLRDFLTNANEVYD